MKAYAAAQPFGSRIGPALTEDSFGAISPPPITPGVNSAVGALGSLAGFIPNLPVRLQDSASRENGWDTAEVVSSMYLGLGVGGGGTNLISAESIGRAYQIAMAPNPYEGTRYTIMSDQGADPFVKNFGTDSFGTFWAPIIPPGSQGEGANLQSLVAGFFDSGVQGNLGNTGTTSDLSNLKTATVLGLSNYISGPLAQGSGENNEGTNLVKIVNPFVNVPDGSPISGSPFFTMTDSLQIKTAWNNSNRAEYGSLGRVGYSVKFISFASLTKQKLSSNGSSSWNNSLNMDPESQQDIPFLQH